MSDGKQSDTKTANSPLAPATVDKVLIDSLKDILSPSQQKQVLERIRPKVEMLAVKVSSTIHSGPLPSVETVEGYEKVAPGSFDRIIRLVERDQDAYIESAKFRSKSNSRFRLMALFTGFFALVIVIGATIYLAMQDHEYVAMSVAGMASVGIISAFVNARFSKAPQSKLPQKTKD